MDRLYKWLKYMVFGKFQKQKLSNKIASNETIVDSKTSNEIVDSVNFERCKKIHQSCGVLSTMATSLRKLSHDSKKVKRKYCLIEKIDNKMKSVKLGKYLTVHAPQTKTLKTLIQSCQIEINLIQTKIHRCTKKLQKLTTGYCIIKKGTINYKNNYTFAKN